MVRRERLRRPGRHWPHLEFATHAILHTENRGYGGSVKSAFAYAIEEGFDFIAVLHADGQYAPEELPRLVAALGRDQEICLLFGSRLSGRPLAGGMPLYKYVGNHILTFLQNAASGLRLSEYHSGYRLYRVALAAKLPLQALPIGTCSTTRSSYPSIAAI